MLDPERSEQGPGRGGFVFGQHEHEVVAGNRVRELHRLGRREFNQRLKLHTECGEELGQWWRRRRHFACWRSRCAFRGRAAAAPGAVSFLLLLLSVSDRPFNETRKFTNLCNCNNTSWSFGHRFLLRCFHSLPHRAAQLRVIVPGDRGVVNNLGRSHSGFNFPERRVGYFLIPGQHSSYDDVGRDGASTLTCRCNLLGVSRMLAAVVEPLLV